MRKELINKKSKFMVVGLVVLSVLTVGFLANCIYRGVTKNRINESFKYGADATGYFELVDTHWNYEEVGGDGIDEVSVKYRNEKWNDFYKELKDIKGVEVIGAYEFVYYHNDCFKEKNNLSKIQGNRKFADYWTDFDEYKSEIFEAVLMNREAFELYNIEIEKGKKVSELDNDNVIYVYLGNEYKDVKVGTRYTYETEGEYKTIIEVAGILKKNTTFVDLYDDTTKCNIKKPVLDLDYSAIQVSNIDMSFNRSYYYSTKNKEDLARITKSIYKVALKHDIELKTGKVDDKVKEIF